MPFHLHEQSFQLCHCNQCIQEAVAVVRGHQLPGERDPLTKETSDPDVSHQSPTRSPDSKTEERVAID